MYAVSPVTSVYPIYQPTVTTIAASAISPLPYVATVPTVPTIYSVNSYLPMQTYPNVVTYPDVNSNKQLRNNVIDYIYNKIVGNWLKYQYFDLYKLLEVSNGTVSFVKSMNKLDSSDKDVNAKYDFILRNFLNRETVSRLIDKFRRKNNINWWNIKDNSDVLRKYIQHKLEKFMKSQINTV